MKKILLIALLLLSNQVQAAPPSWLYPTLKVKNPNELAAYVNVSEACPVTTDELKAVVSGVLIRARVRPLLSNAYAINSLYLDVAVSCVKSGGYLAFSLDISFGNYSVTPPVHYPYDYGSIGIGAKDFIISSLKSKVEAAVTDYIAANFDL